jgi:hypothetical protein
MQRLMLDGLRREAAAAFYRLTLITPLAVGPS